MRSLTSLHPPTLRANILSTVLARTWVVRYIKGYARERIIDVLRKSIQTGNLIIKDSDEKGILEFGLADSAGTSVTLTVIDPNMWVRIMFSNDLGVSEAYMNGEFEVTSLKGLLNLWLDNRKGLTAIETSISGAFSRYSALAINALGRQSLQVAQWNVEVAYNTSNTFFQTFLSKEMMYSCALQWSDAEHGVRGDLTVGPTEGDLEAAQLRKIHTIIKKARLRSGDRLLEIGSGWGAMSIEAARLGCTVDTVTLSSEQKAMTEERAKAAGVGDRVRVHLCDYRDLPASFENTFDALITCEMIEAVGPRYMPEFFRVVNWALKKERATVVITSTSRPEHRYTDYQADDFARHYHWPNSHLPSATSLAVAVQDAVPGAFVLHNIEDHGPHYPRTLREWGRRFEKNFTGEVVEELQQKHPQLRDEKALEAFRRKWRYLFIYAEVGFARAYATLNCWTFTRPENVAEVCA
ncbi:cyclopropane fatty acid synthase [Lentinus brumalis]|uniref:Cyclopropane fatty acid synthase n=1 Tax=Lentinus brumalis TaxID=2498619 RepID=A0A371DFI7_9APHY|nr:cyclopropane fatty acid synthase [Polyporus brumalis]